MAFSFAKNAEQCIGALPVPPAKSFGVALKHGKSICRHASSIPENDLKRAICKMLNISEFDPQTVKANLECIRIASDGSLTPEFIQRETWKWLCKNDKLSVIIILSKMWRCLLGKRK